ncbi:MAG: helix-turn-helix domain-containing protein [Ruminococcus sp.]|nr:helix-turn-helix domain-containing protein [Ruminococcus sp.]
MNKSFSRNITLLRKEKNLSQKQAAQELGISQALLSHYEKGIRECSLDFVCKIADYYDVSADFLLGRNYDRNISEEDASKASALKPSGVTPGGRLQMNTLNVIYRTLGKIGRRKLTRNVSELLMLTQYRILRAIYPESVGEEMLFSVDGAHYQGYTASAIIKLFSDIEAQCAAIASSEIETMPKSVSTERFLDDFPEDAASALNVITHAETIINKIK